jgi:PAS domain S-box-containing protein
VVDCRIAFVNDAFCRYFDKNPGELLGELITEFVPEEDSESFLAEFNAIDKADPTRICEFRVLVPGGETRWVQWLTQAVFNDQDRVVEYQTVGRDITDRKRAEEMLEASERRFRSLVETAKDVIWTLNLNLDYTYVSPSVTNLLGYTPEEIMLMHPLDMLTPSSRERMLVALTEEMELERKGSREKYAARLERIEQTRKDGSIVSLEITVTFLRGPGGEPTGFLGISRDITDRKRMEEALRVSERKYRSVLESSPDPIVVYDREGRTTYVNPAFVHTFGWTEEELLGKVIDYVPEEESLGTTSIMTSLRHGRAPGFIESRRRTKDGSTIDVLISSSVLTDETGAPFGFILVFRDVSERKRAEDALRRSEERYRRLVDTMNEGLCMTDEGGRFTFVNDRFCDMLGSGREEIIGRTVVDLVDPNDEERLWENWRAIRRGDPEAKYELLFIAKDGRQVPTIASVRCVYGDDGSFRGTFTVVTDIALVKEMEQALRRSHEELEKRVEERTAELKTANEKLRLEIGERIQAEEALRRSEEKYRSLFEGSRDAIVLATREGRLADANPAFLDLFGYSREELETLTAPQIWADPAERIKWQKVMDRDGSVGNYAWRIRRKDGSIGDCLLTSTLRSTEDGGLLYESIIRDITEQKRAEEALRQSERRFRAIFESARDCIFIKDANLRYTHVNPAMQSLFEASESQVTGMTDVELFGPEQARIFRNEDRRVLAGQIIEAEHTITLKGREITLISVKIPMRDSEDNTTGVCGIARDITERRKVGARRMTSSPGFKSAAMRSTMGKARLAARTDSLVLLTGESGSGKDFLARLVHMMSPRSNGPFFSINCAALAQELAESELFGHEPGAFTGARGRKRGMLELAEGGTLLLNEIGELSLLLQAKLLTFLDTRSFTRVGGEKSIEVNARLIAATNRDLREEVEKQRFRNDLFHRLNVFSIEVPPLRKRRTDLPELVEAIVADLAAKFGFSEAPLVDSRTLAVMGEYHWPGNIRELRNVLERAMILTQGAKIGPGAIRLWDRSGDPSLDNGWSVRVKFPEGQTLNEVTAEVKRELIKEALSRASGVKKAAARLLGISPDSFKHHAKSLGL